MPTPAWRAISSSATSGPAAVKAALAAAISRSRLRTLSALGLRAPISVSSGIRLLINGGILRIYAEAASSFLFHGGAVNQRRPFMTQPFGDKSTTDDVLGGVD